VATMDSNLQHDPIEDEYETEPLPLPRRRRLPMLTAVLVLGVVAGGAFVGGVEVQKHEGGTSSGSAGSNASAFAARLGRTATGGTATTTGGGGSRGGLFGGGATIGTVTAIKGSTLYVTDSSGNTVKVTTSAASSVTKTVSSSLKGINPGDTIVVRGSQAENGTIAAESISVGAAGGRGGGGSGFGGSGSSGGASGFGDSGSGSSGGATGFGGGGG
jgi:hypothetical protein